MNKPSLKLNIILSMAFQILNIITPLITAPYISRVLGSNSVGIYSYTSSLQLYFSIFAALGTATYGCREISINRDNIEKRSKLFLEIEILTIFTSIISLALYFILIYKLQAYKIYLLILGIKILNTMLDISWFFIGLEEMRYVVYKNAFFKLLGIILLFLLIKKPSDLALYIFIMCITTFLGTITMWMYIPRFVIKTNVSISCVFKHFRYTIIYFVPTIATSIYSNIDKTLIGFITNNMDESAYYEQTTKILDLAKSITYISLNSIMSSRMSYLYSTDRKEEMKKKMDLCLDYISFVSIGMLFGMIGISKEFVPIFFGDGYAKVANLLNIFIIVVFFTGISNCLETQYYTPAGRRKDSTKFIVIGTIINVILNFMFIPWLSSLGAIIASIISEIIIFIMYITNCNGYTNFNIIIGHVIPKIIAGIFMLIIIQCVDIFIPNGISNILSKVLVGFAFYTCSLIVFKDGFVYKSFSKYILKK